MIESAIEQCWICRVRLQRAVPDPVPAPASLCAHCSGTVTRAYDAAWEVLFKYLNTHWKDISQRGSFDLSKAFGANAAAGALNTHLYFVKLLGSKLFADTINVDLTSFSAALEQGLAHPEITLLIANCTMGERKLLYYDSDVSVLARADEVYSAVWMHLAYPVAVKVCYLKSSAPVVEPEGFPWHPSRQRKIVKLSPYKGDTRPLHARRDLRM